MHGVKKGKHWKKGFLGLNPKNDPLVWALAIWHSSIADTSEDSEEPPPHYDYQNLLRHMSFCKLTLQTIVKTIWVILDTLIKLKAECEYFYTINYHILWAYFQNVRNTRFQYAMICANCLIGTQDEFWLI